MARPLTPQAVNSIAGAAGIVVVLGIAAYFYFGMAHVAPQPAQTKQYNLTVIDKDLRAPDATNVFIQTLRLSPPTSTDVSSVTSGASYSSDEIGKTDLTQLGK